MTVTDALAVARLTRLITADDITEPIREAWTERFIESKRWGEFLTCPWCVSMYAAAFAVVARRKAPWLWGPLSETLALSEVSGIAAWVINTR